MFYSYQVYIVVVLFFKQKTGYEMRISDWSSDVCSSDLCVDHAFQAVDDEEVTLLVVIAEVAGAEETLAVALEEDLRGFFGSVPVAEEDLRPGGDDLAGFVGAEFLQSVGIDDARVDEIGRASCRERVCQYV